MFAKGLPGERGHRHLVLRRLHKRSRSPMTAGFLRETSAVQTHFVLLPLLTPTLRAASRCIAVFVVFRLFVVTVRILAVVLLRILTFVISVLNVPSVRGTPPRPRTLRIVRIPPLAQMLLHSIAIAFGESTECLRIGVRQPRSRLHSREDDGSHSQRPNCCSHETPLPLLILFGWFSPTWLWQRFRTAGTAT